MFHLIWFHYPHQDGSTQQEELRELHRFSNRSLRFLDAYRKGLNGKQVAWANRKYRGHRTLPDSILQELGDNQIT
ncbi:hypothetical protein EV424DRAFT_1542659 [Suillus variegatus]|nr:hypothetical protein EV424DRAFT_1542659 [Suillus variegatus]